MRPHRKVNILSIFKKIYHPLYFILALFLGGLIGHKIKTWVDFGDAHTEPWMLLTSLTIILLVILKDRWFETKAIRALENVTVASEDHYKSLTTWIQERLNPTIISLKGEKVLQEASNIINAAIKEPSDAEKYVVFAGSAALYKDPPNEDLDTESPLASYRTSMAKLGSETIPVVRYISLMDPKDFKRRGSQTKEDYLKWLEKQINLIERNPQYHLLNCPRAPGWGSSRSSIFTARALLDIVGNGISAVLIRGDQVAQDLKNSSKELFEEKAVVKPFLYDKSALVTYIKKLKDPDAALPDQGHP